MLRDMPRADKVLTDIANLSHILGVSLLEEGTYIHTYVRTYIHTYIHRVYIH